MLVEFIRRVILVGINQVKEILISKIPTNKEYKKCLQENINWLVCSLPEFC